MKAGTLTDVRNFFALNAKPVSTKEFMDMWKNMSDEEKEEFKKQAAEYFANVQSD